MRKLFGGGRGDEPRAGGVALNPTAFAEVPEQALRYAAFMIEDERGSTFVPALICFSGRWASRKVAITRFCEGEEADGTRDVARSTSSAVAAWDDRAHGSWDVVVFPDTGDENDTGTQFDTIAGLARDNGTRQEVFFLRRYDHRERFAWTGGIEVTARQG